MDALGINLTGLITQIVSFLILFLLLSKLLYKPIVGMLDQRAEKIRSSLESAERAAADIARSEETIRGQLHDAKSQGQELIAQARETAEKFRDEEMAKVRREMDEERLRARENIEREKIAAIEELRSEFAGLAVAAAEKIVNDSLDGDVHKRLIQEVLEQSTVGSN